MKRLLPSLFLLLFLTFIEAQEPTSLIGAVDFNTAPTSISFSPDSSLLLAGFADGSFRILDPETLEISLEVKDAHLKAITAMEMPPKMDFIMTAGGKLIKVWSRDGKHVGNFTGHATTIWTADMSTDGRHAVSSAFNKTFLLWDVYNGVVEKKMQGHTDVCLATCISPDDKMIASGSHDQRILLWDLETGEVIRSLHGPTQEVMDVCFSPDSKILAAASKENSIRVYDVKSGTLLHLLKGHREAVRRLSFSPDGRYLLSSSEDQSTILWDAKRGEKIHTYYEGGGEVLDVAFHPGGKSFYTGSMNGGLKHMMIDPEVFVLAYYGTEFLDRAEDIPELKERQKGESRKEYEARLEDGNKIRRDLIISYYARYLEEY